MINKDISEVYKIERLLFNDPWPKKSFRTEITHNDISFPFTVEEDNEIVGYIICWYYIEELHIGNIAVVPSRQR
jgi:ribosomal-protein-alanine N-acetyltransferase